MLRPMAAVVPTIHVEGDRLSMPPSALDHSGFRAWVTSTTFPEDARASWVRGEVFLEVSPESAESHNKVKLAVTTDLTQLVRSEKLGEVYCDGMLLTHAGAALSTEPDLILATWEAFDSGRLRLVEKSDRQGEFIELEGTPDLVVEVVSDSSQRKDRVALREAYFRAGIPEYWLIDARGAAVHFEILGRSSDGYVTRSPAGGEQLSAVLARAFRLTRERNRAGRWDYRLIAS